MIWCQGFSEPEAGSDLAALRTKAVIDGEHLVVSGQKLWTSFATVADYQELLVRTDNTGSKHKGITWVICDMRTPGIDVRPIETIEGGSEFCEVFYDDVRIPLSNVVGEVGEGWSVAMATLSFERGTAFTANQVRLAKTIEDLIDYARDHVGPDGRRPAIADDDIARRLARARASVASLRALTYTNICEAMKTETPWPARLDREADVRRTCQGDWQVGDGRARSRVDPALVALGRRRLGGLLLLQLLPGHRRAGRRRFNATSSANAS